MLALNLLFCFTQLRFAFIQPHTHTNISFTVWSPCISNCSSVQFGAFIFRYSHLFLFCHHLYVEHAQTKFTLTKTLSYFNVIYQMAMTNLKTCLRYFIALVGVFVCVCFFFLFYFMRKWSKNRYSQTIDGGQSMAKV